MKIKTIIHNTIIFSGEGRIHGYVAIDSDGFIAEVGQGDVPQELASDADDCIDAAGAWLLPGVIDEHVHFRDPGLTHKADIASESLAAAAGGVTSVMDMPNTRPATVSLEAWRQKTEIARKSSAVNYAAWIGATADNFNELAGADYSKIPGVKIFAGTSTGNMAVGGDELFRKIFTEIPALKAVHSEDDAIIARNAREACSRYGGESLVPVEEHPQIRSRQACLECTRHLVELQRATDTRLQVMHISTADELDYFTSGPSDSKRLTAETCVQYLWWSDSDYTALGAKIKCNPAIKSAADREALRQAVRNGVIDVIATDHAPHLPQDKVGGALTAASGIPLIQFSLPMMLELCHAGVFDVETVVEKMCHAPARIFGIDRRGFIKKGMHADLTLVSDGTGEPYTVTANDVISKCGWTPLEGTKLHHRVLSTWVNGSLVWDGKQAFLTGKAQALEFKTDNL